MLPGDTCSVTCGCLLLQVRKSAGEQLYVKLLTLEDHPTLTEDSLEPALEVLSETTWDGSAAEVRAARNKLYGPLGLQPQVPQEAGVSQHIPAAQPAPEDGASYSALLTDAARAW